jgi:hypothetical protein
MIDKKAFELSLENQLKLRVIEDEVKNCTNVEVLQEHLISTSKLVVKYQNLIAIMAQETLLAMFPDELKEALIEGQKKSD